MTVRAGRAAGASGILREGGWLWMRTSLPGTRARFDGCGTAALDAGLFPGWAARMLAFPWTAGCGVPTALERAEN